MNVDEIERAALHGAELPDNLSQPRQLLFLSFRALYREYREKAISKFQAHAEKLKILKVYKDAELNWNLYQETAEMRSRLSVYCSDIEKNGCDKCRLAVRIFEGRTNEGGQKDARA